MTNVSYSLWMPTAFGKQVSHSISAALTGLLADTFALYLKAKNFHWHVSGPHFRDYHLMLDEQADEIFAMIDVIGERTRTVGGTTLRSIGHISRLQRIADSDAEDVSADDMLVEFAGDNQQFLAILRYCRATAEQYDDAATVSLIDGWIGETERRIWFLSETARGA